MPAATSRATKHAIQRPGKTDIEVFLWPSTQPINGVIQLLHGMAEHIERYQWLAEQLNSAGWHVIGHNHRGHGAQTANPGHYDCYDDERNGWQGVLNDVFAVADYARQQWPQQPLVLLGHSMGSFIAQHCVMQQPLSYQAMILSGSNKPNQLLLRSLKPILWFERTVHNLQHHSSLIDKLSFSSFNRQVGGGRTGFEWLSRDPQQVDAYIDDPLCGQLSTVGLWCDFSDAMLRITPAAIACVPAALPVYILSGDNDPVGEMGKGVSKLAAMWRHNGNTVDFKLYPDGRHELFNDTNRQQVVDDLLPWLAEQ
ncbi:Monoacylglycerol lipase [Sinobacterium norvegicum]|uniref:Monoacylglycerol lipase n=1 Tax=Sinobacterium norvegicum TaxID=1641715 RepID=A0ABN8EJB7_9GAMM|nr:alpha/beta hydrolase [Sinobacterium norvegicum]CAH0991748.1 Monoacylglycerol lipase [Sinobacterium norvegicum]